MRWVDLIFLKKPPKKFHPTASLKFTHGGESPGPIGYLAAASPGTPSQVDRREGRDEVARAGQGPPESIPPVQAV